MAAIKRYLVTACLLLCVAALPDRALSQTYQAEVNGTTYEFYTVTGADLATGQLENQFWWVDDPNYSQISSEAPASLVTTVGQALCGAAATCTQRFAYAYQDFPPIQNAYTWTAYYDAAQPTNVSILFYNTGSPDFNSAEFVVARAVPVPEISSSGAAASLAAIFALMLLLREAMMRRKVVSNNA